MIVTPFRPSGLVFAVGADLAELLRQYPKWRYQSMILRRLSSLYTSLRGYLSDQVREMNFYRLRLTDLSASPGRLDLDAESIAGQG